MTRICAFLTLTMLIMLQSALFTRALADSVVRMSNDASVVDETGKTIAVPNPSDPRNNDYQKYYTNVGANGQPSSTSDFFVISDPDSGFVRKELNTPPQTASNTPAEQNSTVQTTDVKASVTNPGHTNQELRDDPARPVYDNMANEGAVYAN